MVFSLLLPGFPLWDAGRLKSDFPHEGNFRNAEIKQAGHSPRGNSGSFPE
jgi:hypothetical protein